MVEILREGAGDDSLLPLPGTPVNGMPPEATLTPSMLPDVSATQTPEAPSTTPEHQATAVPPGMTPTHTPTTFYFPTSTLALEATSAGDVTD